MVLAGAGYGVQMAHRRRDTHSGGPQSKMLVDAQSRHPGAVLANAQRSRSLHISAPGLDVTLHSRLQSDTRHSPLKAGDATTYL